MTYCSIEDIKKRISASEISLLSNDNPEDGSIDENNVNEAISDAEELINGYLRSRYILPITNSPKMLLNICADITIYNLFLRRYRTNMPESVENHYKNNIKNLEQIQKGLISLDIETISTQTGFSSSGFYRTNKTSNDRMFTKEFLNGF